MAISFKPFTLVTFTAGNNFIKTRDGPPPPQHYLLADFVNALVLLSAIIGGGVEGGYNHHIKTLFTPSQDLI